MLLLLLSVSLPSLFCYFVLFYCFIILFYCFLFLLFMFVLFCFFHYFLIIILIVTPSETEYLSDETDIATSYNQIGLNIHLLL